MKLYALHDSVKGQGMFEVTLDRAKKLNEAGYGIFFTPNVIDGQRKEDNVVEIKYWFADIDTGSKAEQMEKIDTLLYKPSIIVESKRGYHLYWKAMEAGIENYRKVMKGIIEKVGSDASVQGANRTMRMPNFYHMKNPKEPFMVKVVFKSPDVYTEKEMLYGFPIKPKFKKSFIPIEPNNKEEMLNPENWDRIFKISSIANGCRNNEMVRIILWMRDVGIDSSSIKWAIGEINNRISEPLDAQELNLILRGKV